MTLEEAIANSSKDTPQPEGEWCAESYRKGDRHDALGSHETCLYVIAYLLGELNALNRPAVAAQRLNQKEET